MLFLIPNQQCQSTKGKGSSRPLIVKNTMQTIGAACIFKAVVKNYLVHLRFHMKHPSVRKKQRNRAVKRVHSAFTVITVPEVKRRQNQHTSATYVQNKLSHFSIHLIAIIPDAVEPKHFAVELQELAQFVHVTRRLRRLRYLSLPAHAGVRIFRTILRSIHLNTFTLKILLSPQDMQCK